MRLPRRQCFFSRCRSSAPASFTCAASETSAFLLPLSFICSSFFHLCGFRDVSVSSPAVVHLLQLLSPVRLPSRRCVGWIQELGYVSPIRPNSHCKLNIHLKVMPYVYGVHFRCRQCVKKIVVWTGNVRTLTGVTASNGGTAFFEANVLFSSLWGKDHIF